MFPAVEITVLGKSNSWPDAGGACSGYLLAEGNFHLLLDCGSGVLSKLRQVCDYRSVDAIVVSHLHADHFLDLIPYSYALKYSDGAPYARPQLFGPPGTRQLFAKLAGAMGFGDQLERVFELAEYDPADQLSVGPLALRFQEVPHYIRTFACEFINHDGRRFTYGADCRYNDALIGFAQSTDLLLVEATVAEQDDPAAAKQTGGHMTARQAGTLARKAQAVRALISHFSDELDRDRLEREASAGFGQPVLVAVDGARFTV
jgi:ribonuclease BN (tRNA processing enzyme)